MNEGDYTDELFPETSRHLLGAVGLGRPGPPPFRLLSLGPSHCVSAPSKTHAHRGTALAPLLVPLNLRLAENPTASRGWEGMLG